MTIACDGVGDGPEEVVIVVLILVIVGVLILVVVGVMILVVVAESAPSWDKMDW